MPEIAGAGDRTARVKRVEQRDGRGRTVDVGPIATRRYTRPYVYQPCPLPLRSLQLVPAIEYLWRATGFHPFAEFVAEDIGTVDSGLNSVVSASNDEMVLLPINEPTFGTRRKSQIQTYLEQNRGPGVQHIALKTDDIFATVRRIRERSEIGGLELLASSSAEYYLKLPQASRWGFGARGVVVCGKSSGRHVARVTSRQVFVLTRFAAAR